VGLYISGSLAARFKDIRCEDLRDTAPVLYRFPFTTSRFANFAHHVQSFDDEVWRVNVPPPAALDGHLALAAELSVMPSDEELLAYDALATEIFGTAVSVAPRVEVSRIVRGGQSVMFHIASPEPFDWRRIDCHVTRLDDVPPARRGKSLKIANAVLQAATAAQELVTLFARETIDVGGYRLYFRPVTSTEAAFDVPLSEWQLFHELGPIVIGVGRSLVISSGTAASPPAVEPGVECQFAGTTDPRLDGTAFDLMLVAPDGQRGHGRRFVSGGAPAEFRFLRRRDGLGCFMIPTLLPLAFGSYRLAWTFLRDRVVDGSTFGLSEAGSSAPERAAIDIPWRTVKV